MAETNVNSGIVGFECGGRLLITRDGDTDTSVVLNVIEGSLRMVEGGEEAIVDRDRGTNPAAPRRGADRESSVSFDVKYTASTATGELEALLSLPAGAGRDHQTYTVEVQIPPYRGAPTGFRFLRLSRCYVTPGSLGLSAGAEFDTLSVSMMSMDTRIARGDVA